jgi:hypothetical protein
MIHTTLSTHDFKQVFVVGKLSRSKQKQACQAKRERIEEVFMGMAFKVSRAEAQKAERRAKRK